MQRIRAKIQRIKPVQEPMSEPVKRVVDGYTKVGPDLYSKNNKFFRKVKGYWFECYESGLLKDQKTKTHVCWFGKITKRPSEETLKEVGVAINKKMIECFGADDPGIRGVIIRKIYRGD